MLCPAPRTLTAAHTGTGEYTVTIDGDIVYCDGFCAIFSKE